MSDSASPYVVLGATGQQGGRVAEALRTAGAPVRAVVRDPSSDAAARLVALGAETVRGDQEDGSSLVHAFEGAAGVFAMTTYSGSDGVEGEVRRGTIVADAIIAAEVPRVVYSSVGGAERHSGVPHFESKRRVEERLEGYGPARFLRPTFFMDNLAQQIAAMRTADDAVLRFPLPGEVALQMVAVRDIGRAGAALLLDPDAIPARSIEIAGDELTLDAAARAIAARLGRDVRFEALPIGALGDDADRVAMIRWFEQTPAYRADLAGTHRLVPDVLSFSEWLADPSGPLS